MNITRHAKERYVERVKDIEKGVDLNAYLTANEDRITKEINKMFDFSEDLYEGKTRDYKYAYFKLHKDGWIIIHDKENVVTLYKIELNAGEDLNRMFMEKKMENINNLKEQIVQKNQSKIEENSKLREDIEGNENTIKQYKKLIKQLEDENVIKNDLVKLNINATSVLDRELKTEIEELVCTKVF